MSKQHTHLRVALRLAAWSSTALTVVAAARLLTLLWLRADRTAIGLQAAFCAVAVVACLASWTRWRRLVRYL